MARLLEKMEIKEVIRRIPDPRLRRYHNLEQDFIASHPSEERFVLYLDSPELEQWITYFDTAIGVRPWALRRLLASDSEDRLPMTVVCQFPHWLDPNYKVRQSPRD